MKEHNPYMRGLKRNSLHNLIAGIILAAIITIINLLTGCEQPELQQRETTRIDSLQTGTKDSIENWDNDTTVYHTTTKTN